MNRFLNWLASFFVCPHEWEMTDCDMDCVVYCCVRCGSQRYEVIGDDDTTTKAG